MHRVTHVRGVPGALDDGQRPTGPGRHPLPAAPGPDPVVRALDDQDGAPDPGGVPLELARLGADLGQDRVDHDGRVAAPRPPDGVLDLLGRVRLRERLAEEELDEVLPATLHPVVPVVPGPAGGAVGALLERVAAVLEGGPGAAGRDEHQARHPVRVVGRHPDRTRSAHREAHQDRAVHAHLVQDSHRVLRELGRGVCRGTGRAVPLGAASPLEGDHPGVPRQRGDLQLPDGGRDDGPRRQEQHGDRVVVAVDGIREPDPGTDGHAGAVGRQRRSRVGTVHIHRDIHPHSVLLLPSRAQPLRGGSPAPG